MLDPLMASLASVCRCLRDKRQIQGVGDLIHCGILFSALRTHAKCNKVQQHTHPQAPAALRERPLQGYADSFP
jgi:hypothetical protein